MTDLPSSSDPDRILLEAEAELYGVLNDPNFPRYSDLITQLTFQDTPAQHNLRLAVRDMLLHDAQTLQSTAKLLEELATQHGVPL